jgi:uncharacterized protein
MVAASPEEVVASPEEEDLSAAAARQEVGEGERVKELGGHLHWACTNSIVTRTAITVIALMLSLGSSALAAEPRFPALTGRVVDDAGVLNASTRNELTDMLAAHERATGEQVVVVTLDSLQGFSIEDFGYQLGRYWGIGQRGKNNGVLLIVAPKEHKVRIEVGYGLEGWLTDATSRTIIETDILPSFKRGDFNAGVLAGTTSILKVLGGSGAPMDHSFLNDHFVPIRLLFDLLVFIIILVIRVTAARNAPKRSLNDTDEGAYWGPGVYPGGGGGGFSGGGGSFGGGGASGGW